MTVVPFDTLKLADQLQAGGFTSEQARTAASAFAVAMSRSDLVTRADLLDVKAELKADIASVKVDLLKTILGAIAINSAVVIGAMFGLAKLLGH